MGTGADAEVGAAFPIVAVVNCGLIWATKIGYFILEVACLIALLLQVLKLLGHKFIFCRAKLSFLGPIAKSSFGFDGQ